MSANDCTVCKIVGREIESGIVHNKEGGIAFKYVNGTELGTTTALAGAGWLPLARVRGGEHSVGMP